jgi:hypothetical protein
LPAQRNFLRTLVATLSAPRPPRPTADGWQAMITSYLFNCAFSGLRPCARARATRRDVAGVHGFKLCAGAKKSWCGREDSNLHIQTQILGTQGVRKRQPVDCVRAVCDRQAIIKRRAPVLNTRW